MDIEVAVRQLLVFSHLFLFAFAVVAVLKKDMDFLQGKPIDFNEMRTMGYKLGWTLFCLWLTGAALIYMAVGTDLSALLSNGKLMAKISVVLVLTLNGVLLHLFAFPKLKNPTPRAAEVCLFLGAISSVSWAFASFIGAARAVAPHFIYQDFMGLYLIALVASITVALLLMRKKMKVLLGLQKKDVKPHAASQKVTYRSATNLKTF